MVLGRTQSEFPLHKHMGGGSIHSKKGLLCATCTSDRMLSRELL